MLQVFTELGISNKVPPFFFSLGFICHVVSRNYSEFRFRNMKMVKSACKTRRGGGDSNSSSSSPISMDVTAPFG